MKKGKRNAVFSEIKGYCHMADADDFIEVTEWSNGEGFDTEVSGPIQQRFQLTWGQFKLLKKLVKQLDNFDNES